MATSEQIVIVGGGLAGISAAESVAKAGLSVIVLEADGLGGAASTRNQGWLHSGGLYAVNDPLLARMCLQSMSETVHRYPECLDFEQQDSHPSLPSSVSRDQISGMYYVISSEETSESKWTSAWASAGIRAENVVREEFLNLIPAFNPDLLQSVYRLPDRIFSPDILLEDLAADARNHGAQIRLGTRVVRLIVRGNKACGIVTGDGEEIPAAHVILAGIDALRDLDVDGQAGSSCQPLVDLVNVRTHLVSVRPSLSQTPFVIIDRHGFNHLPHADASVFHSGVWKATASQELSGGDGFSRLWSDIATVFPRFDRTSAVRINEWSGCTLQALGVDQIFPGSAPCPAVIEHCDQGGPENLWSIHLGRATLWAQVADKLRQKILARSGRAPLTAASPPWRS